ncbi:inorganic diphosphatase [Chengkuizengella axinellae]|uniref:inorganic diphosphatase n=1 Tax=Chengkuizengella axinellae TaxID=3064388 RepID=A0ABT9J4W2_9BACL|nr:inorganic diphosphatase [Chengkuizengella sp. 2205SS18-9]MDP5276657.1 inorganic diphosphatase [Chengkuizengella sp. 2205SS18-9]
MYTDFLSKRVTVEVDRPLGSKHPKFDAHYPVNYGYIPNTKAGDGEEIDAYILGEDRPLESFEGTVIAVIHRKDDVEDKLVVANEEFQVDEIKSLLHFQEQYFDIEVIIL